MSVTTLWRDRTLRNERRDCTQSKSWKSKGTGHSK
jgi:hypothetical protein